MEYNFFKFSATGNDFIIVDNMNHIYDEISSVQWARLCRRSLSIGADGVLLLGTSDQYDFSMRYLNADGGEVAMCGNGARAITFFAHNHTNSFKNQSSYTFETKSGVYHSEVKENSVVRLEMSEIYDAKLYDLSDFNISKNSFYINTGVPHCVFETFDLKHIDLVKEARPIRFDSRFIGGTNINFFERTDEHNICVRTYERGVEAETLACGTGAVATCIYAAKLYGIKNYIEVAMAGGILTIEYNQDLTKVYLSGEATMVYRGRFIL